MMKQETPASVFRPLGELRIAEARAIVGAPGDSAFEDRPLGAISTDTRTIRPGETFLALRGENFDGHAYVETAIRAGAGALIVESGFPETPRDPELPVLRVADPMRAYGDLAAHQRRIWGGQVLALSGSVGKTTTRRLISHALRRHRAVLEPIRNFNNLIGVPKTIERLEARHEVLVAELGINQPGELERLTEIVAPNVAGLTRLGPAHIGMFGSMEALVEAKSAIYRCSPPDAVLVANAECEYSTSAVKRNAAGRDVVWFRGPGEAKAEIHVENAAPLESGGYRFDLHSPEGVAEGARIDAFGRHLLEDIAAAAAFLHAGGYPAAWAVESLGDFRTEPMRGQILRKDGMTFIVDCYNAAPAAMFSALETLAAMPREGRLLLVLADMLELGDFSVELHDRLAGLVDAARPDRVFTLGEQLRRVGAPLGSGGLVIGAFENRDALTDALKAALEPGDLVFFKGSRRFELEKAAAAVAGEIPGWDAH